MILVVDAGSRCDFAVDLTEMHCHRKAVFVDRAGWKLPVVSDQEIDRYDLMEGTVYLLCKDEAYGPVLASSRLLATTGPHLMQDLYPASRRPLVPSGPTVWEVSRYCTAPGIKDRNKRLGLLWETICGIMEMALEHGINQVIFAANRALLPLAVKCGWDATTVGPLISDRNDEVTAVVASVTPDGLRKVRDRHGVPAAVVRMQACGKLRDISPYAKSRNFADPNS